VKNLISVLSPEDSLLSKEEATSITIERAHNRLDELLSNQTILLIIDEVYDKTHLEPFLHIGEHCSRLIITRNKEIKEILPHATPIQVGPMETEEAEYVLSAGLNTEDKELKSTLHNLVKHLWRWPLSLASANELLKKRTQQSEQLISLDQIEFLLERFTELVIFPPDIDIPLML